MADLLLAVDQLPERYTLSGADELVRFSAGKNIHISVEPDRSPRDRDSSRVQSHGLSDYKWDVSHVRSHSDRLLSVNGALIAYRLSHETSVEAVRVMQRETRNRQLIKGFKDAIVDLSFSRQNSMLAVLDAACNLYIYHVTDACGIEKHLNLLWEDEEGKELLKGVMVELQSEEDKENPASSRSSDRGSSSRGLAAPSPRPKLVWCPYQPDPDEPDDSLNMVAIIKGCDVHIVNITDIKGARRENELHLAAVREIPGAVHTITLKEPVTSVTLSPDATAIAISDATGTVYFYVINGEVKFEYQWTPTLLGHLKEIFFLDSVDATEQFWRFVVAVDESGKNLALYECQNWACIGRLHIDASATSSSGGKYMVQMDPQARYLYLIDIEGSNIFCLEIGYHNDTQKTPCFAGITQIGFYHPLVAVSPYEVKDADNQNEYSFDDDDGAQAPGEKNESVISLITITPKSVQHLQLTLERTPPSALPPVGLLLSPRTAPTRETTSGGGENHSDVFSSLLLGTSSAATTTGASGRGHADGGTDHAVSSAEMESLMGKLEEMNDQMEQLTMRVERSDAERRAAATNESILGMLQQFKEEFSLREDRLLANISDLIETNRQETVNVVRNALNENSVAVENSIQANHKASTEYVMKAVSERTKEALAQIVVPAVDRLLTALFKQINDQFKDGLNQYLQQMRIIQQAVAASTVVSTPAPLGGDRQSLIQMIKSRNVQMAFETVLNQADESSLDFVCKQIDPDELFGNGGDGGLSQPVLLSLLQQLSYRLENDTDLKFRYIEHVMEALQPFDDSISLHVPKVVNLINDSLNEFQLRTPNPGLKRQARVIAQLVRNIMKTPLPFPAPMLHHSK